MKNSPLYSAILIGFLFCACKKHNSSNNNSSSSNAWLSSVTSWQSPTSVVDSFTYDNSHRIASFMQIEYDTSSGAPQQGSWSAVFALPAGSSAPPSSYTNTLTGSPEVHELSYDAQGRIIKDSSVGPSSWVMYFSYPTNEIAITALFDGTIANSIIDTLIISNGNITGARVYGNNNAGTADSLEATIQYGYSTITNPGYHAAIASSIGPLIYILQISGYGGSIDPISQKAFNSISGVGDGLPPNSTINYILATDNQSRLSTSTLSFGGAFAVATFRYY